MKILNRYTEELIYEANLPTIREVVEKANLIGADLEGADLRGANLYGVGNILVFKANSSGRLFYFINGDEINVQAGCFWGTIQELKDKIAKEHIEETHWDYLMACDWAERLWK